MTSLRSGYGFAIEPANLCGAAEEPPAAKPAHDGGFSDPSFPIILPPLTAPPALS